MHRGELDPKGIESGNERSDEVLEPPKLGEAVAEPARERTRVGIKESHLVLQCGERVVTQFREPRKHAPEDLPRGELAGTAIAPARGSQADSPARPPGQLVQGGRVRSNQQISGTRADAEPCIVR